MSASSKIRQEENRKYRTDKYSYPHPRNTPKSQKKLWLTADDWRRKELKAMSKSKEESIEIAITEAPKKTEWGAGSVKEEEEEKEEEKGGLAGMLLDPMNPLAMMDGQE